MKGNFLVRTSHIRDCRRALPGWDGCETIVDSSFLAIHGSDIISFHILPKSDSISSSSSRSKLPPLLGRGLYLELKPRTGGVDSQCGVSRHEAPSRTLPALFPLLSSLFLHGSNCVVAWPVAVRNRSVPEHNSPKHRQLPMPPVPPASLAAPLVRACVRPRSPGPSVPMLSLAYPATSSTVP